MTGPFFMSILFLFVFQLSSLLFLFFGSVRQIKLAVMFISFWAHRRM